MSTIDPITLAVIEKGLQSVCSEMDLVHQKAAFSPAISESYDRSNGIFHRETGEVIAQGALGLPLFVGVMQATTQSVLQERRSDMDDGDIILVNDPYRGGTHLMDVKMVRPFHYRGKIWCYLSNTGHWSDTGGMVPGGFAASATEIQQEGLRIPPVKLYRRGELQQDIVDLVLTNIRAPEERMGDVLAQVGALEVGARRLTELLDRYSAEVVDLAISELDMRSEKLMRAHIENIPDGTYCARSFMDNDGIVDEPLAVDLSVTVKGSEAYFDLSASSPPCAGPLNSVWATTETAIYIGVKHLFPDVPVNAGCFRPLRLKEPKGTFLYAEYPKPVSGCAAEVSQRVVECVLLALGETVTENAVAAPAGTSGNLTLGGVDPVTGREYIMYFFSGGGYGGWAGGDGLTNGCSAIGISRSVPLEIIEKRFPVIFNRYALNEGSAGAGEYRGGFGVHYRLEVLRGNAVASFMMDHGKFGPPGIRGGEPGAKNRISIITAEKRLEPPMTSKGQGYSLAAGDSIEVSTPGGGGFGDSKKRDRERIQRDLVNGYYPQTK